MSGKPIYPLPSEKAVSRIPLLRGCLDCHTVKPASDFYLYRYTTVQGKDSQRLGGRCRQCVSDKSKTRRADNNRRCIEAGGHIRRQRSQTILHVVVSEKTCSRCFKTKSRDEFYEHKSTRDGLRSQCVSCQFEANVEYKRRNPNKVARWARTSALRKRFGLGFDEFQAMCAAQDYRCLICMERPEWLCVDHDHKTGRIRGLLCQRCNVGLGNFKEDKTVLASLVKYIDERCGA